MPPFRVRFAPQVGILHNTESGPRTEPNSLNKSSPTHQRSHLGCRECRQRKVKCDETFPVCKRCQRRGSVCQPALRASQWRLEIPWLGDPGQSKNFITLKTTAKVDSRLMRYWLEGMSQILALDPNNNPFSFPILKYVSTSPSLVYVLQGVSAAHEQYFQQSNMSTSLEERSKALASLRMELQTSGSLSHSFLALLMLGMSSSWITMGPDDYGREHLLAARTVAEMVVEKNDLQITELDHLNMGIYVYWDMACSFCLDPADHPVNRVDSIDSYARQARNKFHAITAHSIDLYHLLGQLGRYCRLVVESGDRNLEYEAKAEMSLHSYTSIECDPAARLLTEAFRKHGLLLLYRFCGKPGISSPGILEPMAVSTYTRQLALEVIDLILQTPPDSPCLNLHAIPLLSAGAEMTSFDIEERNGVRQRLNAVYSTNRLVPTLWVIDLLEELWVLHDAGITHITWLELMLIKNWRLRVG
ncbi:unnamed protein product [Penicillium olsonii]|nr:unnamed protein product [Penicillium olsonii]CAG7932897.1 unnamed protein product [Penicillium olsonii]